LSSEICEKTTQSYIPKLVQNYHLIFSKTFTIIYLQGKERGKQKKEKNLKKPLDKPKSLWYNKDKIREGQQNRNRVVGRAKRLLITWKDGKPIQKILKKLLTNKKSYVIINT
jgi:hypothetical protein